MRSPVSNSKPWVIAHRGNSSVAPENTLAAFHAALEVGADMVELDVHLSADGRVIAIGTDGVQPQYDIVDGSFVERAHAAGLFVAA